MSTTEQALHYLELGLCPLPCMGEGDSKGKVPLIKWREIQTLPTPEEVTKWFTQFPNCNIGFKTGKVSGILVLDNDGVEIKEPIPLTPIATSRPGHFHYYFLHPGFYVPPSVEKVGEHQDIRCDQAFIVAPPSKHFDKKTGVEDGKYVWVDGMSPDDVPFAPCPDWLILKIKETLNKTHGFDWSGALNVGIGGRDDALTRAAASLVAKNFEYETTLAILRGINATYADDGLPDNVVINKLETAIQFIQRQNDSDDDETGEFGLRNFYISGSQISRYSRLKYLSSPIDISEIPEEDEDIDWIWKDYIAKGHLTVLSALWKAGKSTLIGALIKAIQDETEFAGKPLKKCKILIISEETTSSWRIRRKKLGLYDGITLMIKPLDGRLTTEEWKKFIKDIRDTAVSKEIELVIFDTISKFWSVQNENDPGQMETTLLPLNLLLQKDMAVLLIHHFRKSGGEQGLATRGSGVIGATADIMLDYERLNGDPNGTQRKITPRSRFDNDGEIVLDFDKETGQFNLMGDVSDAKKTQDLRRLLRTVRSLSKEKDFEDGVTAGIILDNWSEEDGKKVTKRTIELRLQDLLSRGDLILIGEEQKGKPKFYRATYDNLDISSSPKTKVGEENIFSPKCENTDKYIYSVSQSTEAGIENGISQLAATEISLEEKKAIEDWVND